MTNPIEHARFMNSFQAKLVMILLADGVVKVCRIIQIVRFWLKED